MKTNELKSGTKVKLSNGWSATIKDNMRGNTRLAEVEGLYTEIGSVYSHDIVRAYNGTEWVNVEHTPAQLKLKQTISQVF